MLKEIAKDTYTIDEGGVRCYLLLGEEKGMLIDTGMHMPDIKETVSSVTDREIILINTHCDPDHISGNACYDTLYLHPAEIVNLYRHPVIEQEYRFVKDGDVFDLGKREVEVIYTPGHTPGCISLLDRNTRILFSGDNIQSHSNIFMHGIMRNLLTYEDSLKKVKERESEFDICASCHGDIFVDKKQIDVLLDGVKKIRNKEIAGIETEFFGNKIHRYELSDVNLDTD